MLGRSQVRISFIYLLLGLEQVLCPQLSGGGQVNSVMQKNAYGGEKKTIKIRRLTIVKLEQFTDATASSLPQLDQLVAIVGPQLAVGKWIS